MCATRRRHITRRRSARVYYESILRIGRVYYEASVSRTSSEQDVCVRVGFASENTMGCGDDAESFGYDGSGHFVWNGQREKIGTKLVTTDTVTAAIDFEANRVYFAVNGRIMKTRGGLAVPEQLRDSLLYPFVSAKDARIDFNFGAPRKPCQWLVDQGFVSLERTKINRAHLGITFRCIF